MIKSFQIHVYSFDKIRQPMINQRTCNPCEFESLYGSVKVKETYSNDVCSRLIKRQKNSTDFFSVSFRQ
jgi:hypothetical protein